jgi:hypothetical protein
MDADDSHPKSKFTDPRNADLVTKLDATACVTCHREHAPAMTGLMGVTLPQDYCVICHADVGRDRPSHAGMAFDTCASAGCHNYHDNTALYEDFLVAHSNEPAVRERPRVRDRQMVPSAHTAAAVRVRDARLASDAPPDARVEASQVAAWETTSHARAGVNCTDCHAAPSGKRRWLDRPDQRATCGACHEREVTGFLGGRHGMRVAHGLSPMTPAMARVPMKPHAADRELSCTSCHGAHDFDTRRAAVEACLECHDDRHSLAYLGSPHQTLWTREIEEVAANGSGVACATCHLPRRLQRVSGTDRVVVEHNQNANLRPNEKMARTVCLDCHGLGFSLAALADRALIASNFKGRPLRPVAGIDMAVRRTTSIVD